MEQRFDDHLLQYCWHGPNLESEKSGEPCKSTGRAEKPVMNAFSVDEDDSDSRVNINNPV